MPTSQPERLLTHGARQERHECLAAALLLEFTLLTALWRAQETFDLLALAALSAVFVGSALLLRGVRSRVGDLRLALPVAVFFIAVSVAQLVLTESVYFTASPYNVADRLLPLIALVGLVAGWLATRRFTAWALILTGVAAFTVFLSTQLLRSPTPVIDVWSVCTEAAEVLLAGKNPYVYAYGDIYEQFGWQGFGDTTYFIYLPGLFLHHAAAVGLGLDVRWVNLLAQALGLLLFAACVRERCAGAASPARVLALGAAALVFWFHNVQVHLLEFAWAEALVLFYLCLTLWAWRRNEWLAAAALALGLSLKQTTWFCLPFLAVLAVRERRWRLMAAAAAGATVLVLPFFLWEPAAFFHNVVVILMDKAPRLDSLSWASVALLHAPGLFPWVARLAYAVYAGALACLVFRLWRPDGRDLLLETQKWMALGLFGFFLFLKVSFFNYYYVVAGLLAFYICSMASVGPLPAEAAPAQEEPPPATSDSATS